MGKSQESFSKKEKEKKRVKKRKEKRERREQRKIEREESGPKSFEDMIMYVDHNGNLTDTKPDPLKMIVDIKLEDIVIGAQPRDDSEMDPIRVGKVKFFNDEKGYGFIVDKETKESVFVHINNLSGPIKENDEVSFEVEMGPKGPNAIRVKMYVAPKAVEKPKVDPDAKLEGDAKEVGTEKENTDGKKVAETTTDAKDVAESKDAETTDDAKESKPDA